jgi:hypothetical protein
VKSLIDCESGTAPRSTPCGARIGASGVLCYPKRFVHVDQACNSPLSTSAAICATSFEDGGYRGGKILYALTGFFLMVTSVSKFGCIQIDDVIACLFYFSKPRRFFPPFFLPSFPFRPFVSLVVFFKKRRARILASLQPSVLLQVCPCSAACSLLSASRKATKTRNDGCVPFCWRSLFAGCFF